MKKLLITENLQPSIEAGKSTFLRKGVEIFIASSAEEILNIHKQENVNLIMTDFDMTGAREDGVYAILSDIRDNNALNKVSIITVCDNDKSAIAKSYACGANTFITKPIDSVELFSKIVTFLNIPERVILKVVLSVSIRGTSNSNHFYANSKNISNTGLLFVTDEVLKKDDTIQCSFFVGGRLITTDGKVTRVDRKAPDQIFYGIQFSELSPFSKNTIEAFIKKATEKLVIHT